MALSDAEHHYDIAAVARIGLMVVLMWLVPTFAQAPARNGNQSDFRDWQPTREGVAAEERAAGVRQTPAERKSEDQELQGLYKDLLRQEQPPSPVLPGNSR
jgi:hypothetical protein